MKVIKSRSRVPNGGYWKYHEAETNTTLRHPYLHELEILAKKHRIANNLPIGSNWVNDFDANVCQQHPDLCEESKPGLLTKAQSAAKALGKWALGGFKVVSQEVLQLRDETCAGCEYWEPGRKMFTGKCKKCGCSGVKLYLATETCPLNKWPA